MVSLEICATGLKSAMIAQEEGADRIEICENLESGGLTPSFGLLEAVREHMRIPIHVLIRPRRGNYCYDPLELKIMINDIRKVKAMGFEGVVFGLLDRKGNLDELGLEMLLEASENLSVTFHRAIDVANKPMELIEKLIKSGVQRVLTSGGKTSAFDGIENIASIQKTFGEDIIIIPGAGITSANVVELIEKTGVTEVHLSAKQKVMSQMNKPEEAFEHDVPLLCQDEWWHYSTSPSEVRLVAQLVHQLKPDTKTGR